MQETITEVKKENFITKSGLKARGWTDLGIARFLQNPDKEAVNPHYKSASPMKLYLIERIETAEKSAEFIQWKQESEKRKSISRKTVQSKINKLMDYVKNLKIVIRQQDINTIRKNAIRSYNEFKDRIAFERGDFDELQYASLNSDKNFLNRICVNYLRHRLSNYEKELETLFGKVGKTEAYKVLNQKIYDGVAKTYPELEAECSNQLMRKSEEYAENY